MAKWFYTKVSSKFEYKCFRKNPSMNWALKGVCCSAGWEKYSEFTSALCGLRTPILFWHPFQFHYFWRMVFKKNRTSQVKGAKSLSRKFRLFERNFFSREKLDYIKLVRKVDFLKHKEPHRFFRCSRLRLIQLRYNTKVSKHSCVTEFFTCRRMFEISQKIKRCELYRRVWSKK